MIIGSLCECYDDSLYNQLCYTIQEISMEDYEPEENRRKQEFKNELDFDVKNKIIDQDRADYCIGQMDRITQRARMSTKYWIDKVLLKLKRFANKLERAKVSKDGKEVGIFAKLKAKVGAVIRTLTNLAMKAIGTHKRKGKITDVDNGIGYVTIRNNPNTGKPEYTEKWYRQPAVYK